MKLWIGGEAGPWPKDQDGEIQRQMLSIRRGTEKPLEQFLVDKNYGSGLQKIYIIPMIFRPDIQLYEERRQYNPKKREADYRLKIDYDSFIRAEEQEKRKLIIKNILQVIRLLGIEVREKGYEFDSRQMEQDIREFLKFEN